MSYWKMIEELYRIKDELTPEGEDFITSLYGNLDPNERIDLQLIGLPRSVAKQKAWIRALYAEFCDLDEDEADEIWEEFYEQWGYREAV